MLFNEYFKTNRPVLPRPPNAPTPTNSQPRVRILLNPEELDSPQSSPQNRSPPRAASPEPARLIESSDVLVEPVDPAPNPGQPHKTNKRRGKFIIAHPVHSLDHQPNVILDLIFSFLRLVDLERAVFCLSQRIAAHLRRRSSGVHNPEMIKLFKPDDLQKFLFLTQHWCLRTLFLECRLGVTFTSSGHSEFESAALRQLAISRECPRLEEASVKIFYYSEKQDKKTSLITIDEFVGSFSGCPFLRSFDYEGPAAPGLGRLKQIDRLKLNLDVKRGYIPIFLNELTQLRFLSLVLYFDEWLTILQNFPDLEELELYRFSTEIAEELMKIPTLKTLIISTSTLVYHRIAKNVSFEFPPSWREFKMLERLVLKGNAMKDKIGILPQIPTLRSLELFDQPYYQRPWAGIQEFLSLNLQVNSLILHILKYDELNHSTNLLPMMEFLENHRNLQRLKIMENRFDVLITYETANYSNYVTDRGFFRSPQHRQEFIEELRKLIESWTLHSRSETRSRKRQKRSTES